jgi:hypothetical protein
MNINASNPSLINILLQQASKSQEKNSAKRPTFEEVFTKLNARSARIDANKRPMNNMLTNEQLFRYYIKETDPLLRVSNETFNVEDALNPMKESDPNKIYGRGTTQTSDIIPSRNPYNNAENVGIAPPEPTRPGAGMSKPISGKLASLAQQYGGASAGAPPLKIATASAPLAPSSAGAPADVSGQIPTLPPPEPLGNAAAIQEADNQYKEAIAVNNRLESVDYSSVSDQAQLLLKLFFNDNYEDQSAYFLKQLMDARSGTLESSVTGLFNLFYQVRLNKPTNEFLNNRIAGIVGADFTAGSAVREDFDKLFNLNNVSGQEFLTNIKTKLAGAYFTDREKERMSRELAYIDGFSLANTVGGYLTTKEQDYYRVYGNTVVYNALSIDPVDPFEAFNKAAADERNAEAIFEGLMDELFIDTATEMVTNTDINSTVLDPELVQILAERSRARNATSIIQAAARRAIQQPSDSSGLTSSTIAEAGSPAGVDIDNVITKRGRGVQPGDVRGPYNTEKSRRKSAASTLQAAARRALEQEGSKGFV